MLYKKHSSRAGTGAVLTKTESSEGGVNSFLQELRSPDMNWHYYSLETSKRHCRCNHARVTAMSNILC